MQQQHNEPPADDIPFAQIAAARNKLHEACIPGRPQSPRNHITERLEDVQRLGQALKTTVAHKAGQPVSPRVPLPGRTFAQANQMPGPQEGDEQPSAADPAAHIKAHSPVELPSSHTIPTTQLPNSPRRIPSGMIMCPGGSTTTTAHSDLARVVMTSVPGSAVQDYCVNSDHLPLSDPSEEIDNALAAALAGAGGMEVTGHEVTHGTGLPHTAAGHPTTRTGPTSTAPTSTQDHKPHTTASGGGSSGGGGGGGGGGHVGVWDRVWMAAVSTARADTGGDRDDPSEPQMIGHQDYNPIDSNQTMNMGPSSDTTDRAATGGLTMALGGLKDRIAHGLHNVVEGGAALLGDAAAGTHNVKLEDLPAGMPGRMPEDEEYRSMRVEKAREAAEMRHVMHEEALAATRDAAAAARAGDMDALHRAAEAHRAADQKTISPAGEPARPDDPSAVPSEPEQPNLPAAEDQQAQEAQQQQQAQRGEGIVGRLVHRMADALHLHPAGPGAGGGGHSPHSITPETAAATARDVTEFAADALAGEGLPDSDEPSRAAPDSDEPVRTDAGWQQEQQQGDTGSPEQQQEQQEQQKQERVQPQDVVVEGRQSAVERRADVPKPLTSAEGVHVPQRAPVHPGTFEFEAPPIGEHAADVREQLGIPRAALRNTQLVGDVNTKEGGQMAPSGALGQSRPNPDAYVPSHAVEAAAPNFFSEVERRGIVDVIEHGVANVKEGMHKAKEELSAGGSPAPWSITSGAVSDTKDITRNVERVDHMDDPLQRRIYDAETYKVPALHAKVVHDQQSEEERIKEASNAVVLGKNKPISGAVPHDKPAHPIGSSATPSGIGPKTAAGKSAFDAIGTAQGRGPESAGSGLTGPTIRDSLSQFMGHEEHVQHVGEDAPGGVGSSVAVFMRAAVSKLLPESKAMYPSEGARRGPTADYGDDRSDRPPVKEGAGRAAAHDVPIIPGADIKHQFFQPRSHTAADGPSTKTNTPERMIMEEVISTFKGGPEAAGIPRRGVDAPGGYETMVVGDLAERGKEAAQQTKERLPDMLSRVGESVGGALQHVVDKAEHAVTDFPVNLYGQSWPRESEARRAAKATGDEEQGAFDPYSHPGGVGGAGVEHGGGRARVADTKSGAEWSAHRVMRMEGLLEEPEPARKRDTFMDKVLYPFSKDAGDPTAAKEQAKSYLEYVEEKRQLLEEVSKGEGGGDEQAGSQAETGIVGAVEEGAEEVKGAAETAVSKVKDASETAVSKVKDASDAVKEGVQQVVGSSPDDDAGSSGGGTGLKGVVASASDTLRHVTHVGEPEEPRDTSAPDNRPLQEVSGKAALQSGDMPYGGVTGRAPGPPGAGTGPLDPTKPLHHVYGGNAEGATGLRVAPVIQQAADKMAAGRTEVDEAGAPVSEADAARLAERRQTAAKPASEPERRVESVVHVTGDVVTEVVANLGQSVIDTVSHGLSKLLHTSPPPAEEQRGEVTSAEVAMETHTDVPEPGLTAQPAPPSEPAAPREPAAQREPAAREPREPDDRSPGEVVKDVAGEASDKAAAGVESGIERGAGLAGRVLGALGALLGTPGEEQHDKPVDVGQAAEEGAAEMRERARHAMEPAGHDVGGYGRGQPAEEHHKVMPPPPDIPVVPFISTDELLKQRGEERKAE